MRQVRSFCGFFDQLERVVTLCRVPDPLRHLDEVAGDWRHDVGMRNF